MTINYQNTVNIIGTEASNSLLDKWGTALIKPYRGSEYTVILDKQEIQKGEEKNQPLTRTETFKVKFGILLKKIAAFFNKEIKAKYEVINTKDFESLKPKVKAKPEGSGLEIAMGITVVIGCIIACVLGGGCCRQTDYNDARLYE